MSTRPQLDRVVTVFGASGFLGRHVVTALVRHGYRVVAVTRRPELAHHLTTVGGLVGQVSVIQGNIRNRPSVERAVEGAFGVVNLVGILQETARQGFDTVQHKGAGLIAEAARAAGVGRLVHVSAIGADSASDAEYGRTKALGERAVREAFPGAVILRPSIVFGPEDGFFNRFAAMARLTRVLPLISGETRFQPVYVGDVAEAVARGLDGGAAAGTTYELGGPAVHSFRGLMELMLKVTQRRRLLLPVPAPIARFQAKFLEKLPSAPLTPDQLKMLRRDNVVSDSARSEGRDLQGLGIAPTAMEVILPTYLWRFRATGEFAERMPQPK